MPEKVLFGPDEFEELRAMMLQIGFLEVNPKEFSYDLQRLGLESPRKKVGREIGFSFYANGHRVFVWTTYVEKEKSARQEDLGWVLIKKRDTVPYFAHPLRRTEKFFNKLISFAKICQERILHRPICPECGRPMEIVQSKNFGARFWKCLYSFHKGKIPTVSFDHGLSEESQKFLKEDRKLRAKYRKKRIAENKSWGTARIERKKWNISRPENLEK